MKLGQLLNKVFRRKRQSLRLDFSRAEAARLKAIAQKRGVRVSELMRRAVLTTLDVGDSETPEHPLSAINTAMAKAYAKMDATEETFGGEDASSLTILRPESTGTKLHSCVFLNPSIPRPYKTGECEGVCKHTEQPGKICFYPSASANYCPLFQINKKTTMGNR